ncbi:cation-translocating P-type ATPase [Nocardia huaxiensis]|uniref:Cation-translocating P-type ATPase n=1 Tax=Nocardia huaxiensis TaxID=2755382 RepID=A0A7D6V902_9NOCA|nr:cation-translocating P-type ATPase [Nocardia huaxiensis]QLY29313.1 cation-translocating P-type ATPase [Nocardia huaxiensis]
MRAGAATFTVEELEELLADVEEQAGMEGAGWGRDVEHPSDREPVLAAAVQLMGDVVGIGLAVVGAALPVSGGTQLLRAGVALIDGQPRIRELLERRLGGHRADTVLTLGTALGQALDAQVAGLAADALSRTVRLVEAAGRYSQWRQWDELLAEPHHPGVREYRPPKVRPEPMPAGPVERCTDQVGGAAAVISLTTLSGGRGAGDAADALVAGVPKAARAGREAFAGILATIMASQGVLTIDPCLWRRLDRVSALVVDRHAVRGERAVVLSAAAEDSGWSTEHVWSAAQRLLWRNGSELPIPPPRGRSRDELRLTPCAEVDGASGKAGTPAPHYPGEQRRRSEDAADDRGKMPGSGHGDPVWHYLFDGEQAVGRVLIGQELHPEAVGLLAAARKNGLRVVLIGDDSTRELRRSADEFVQAGGSVTELVRKMQRQGHVVAVLSGRAHRALGAADLGIGLAERHGEQVRVPWQADVVCPELACARRIVAAAGTAHAVSERGRVLTLSAAPLSGLLLATGPNGRRPARATSPVWTAPLLGFAGGVMAGRRAGRGDAGTPVPLVPWHALEPDEVLARLPAPEREEPQHRVVTDSALRVVQQFATPARTLTELAGQVRKELEDPLTPLLAVGAVASAMLGSPTDALLVGSVLGLNAIVSALQRRRAGQSLHRLLVGERLLAHRIAPVNDDEDGEIDTPAEELRPGDIIVLRTGDVVPADARLLEARGLEMDESGLTGESVTVDKQTAATPGAALGDRACMVFEGGVVVNGSARAVVVAVGAGTEAGRALAAAGQPRGGGVQEQLRALSERVLPLTLGGGTLVTAASFLRGLPLRPALADGVAVAVAAVPEGLPLVATVAQLAATRRLSRRGVLVRSSRTIEALGRLDTVCFDKTGTLTAGRLHLAALGDLDESWDTENAAETPQSRRLLRAAARACPHPEDGPLVHATDRAVVEAADHHLGERSAHVWDPIEEVPFESNRGYAAAVGHTAHHIRLAVKGAPEVLLPRCTQVLRADGESGRNRTEFSAEQRKIAEEAVQRMAERGLRVLVVARRDLPSEPEDVTDEIEKLTLLGFIGLADTPRPQTKDLIRQLARNDIRVRMITGDHPVTARAVAEQLGIPADTVATGTDIDALDEDAQAELIDRATVFARVSPEHKVRIVAALQHRGHVVAMTGDGTNDAAAIRTADIGIGLAARGSVAAREAADLIITGSDEIRTPGNGRSADAKSSAPARANSGSATDAHRGSPTNEHRGTATDTSRGSTGGSHRGSPAETDRDPSGASPENRTAAGGIDLTVLLAALVEGRDMWRRVRDAIGVLVGGNAGEVTFTVLGTLLSGRAPIGTRQFLLVNLLTDLGPAMAVALSGTRAAEEAEPADTGSELRQIPRPDLGGDFLRAVAVRGACTTAGAGAAWLLGRATGRQRRAATMALAALIATQLGQTLVIGRHSPLVWVTVAGSTALLAGVIMTPGVNRFFGCTPLGPVAWTIVTGCAVGGTVGAVYAGRRYA